MGIYSNAFDEGVKMADQFSAPKSQPVPQTIQQSKAVASVSQQKPAQPRQYGSGNLLDKAFDVLRTPEYAQAGYVQAGAQKAKELGVFNKAPIQALSSIPSVLKAGIKAIPEAIKTRREFGREAGQYNIAEDAGVKNKYAQTGVNLATSLAAPSLALGPVFKGAGKIAQKIPGVTKATEKIAGLGTKVVDFARKTEPVAKVIEKFDPFFRNKEFGKMVTTAEDVIGNRQSKVVNLALDSAKGLKPEEQRLVGKILEGQVVDDPTGKYNAIAKPIRELSDAIGKEAVDAGLLDPKSYEKYRGKYMTHIWEQMAKKGEQVSFGRGIVPKSKGQFFKQRKGEKGFIEEFTPAVVKGLGSEVKDVEVSRLYKEIAAKYGQKAGAYLEPGRAFAPSSIIGSKAGKVLRNVDLPKEIVDIMEKTMVPKQKGILDKAYDMWKKGKTIYNVPGYHVRNLVSNQILSDMSTEQGIPRTLFNYAKAVSQYKGKGDQSFVDAAKDVGLIGKQNIGAGFEEAMNVAGYGKSKNVLQKADRTLTQFQNASEETSKLNVFTAWVNKLAKESGKAVGDALKDETILKAAKDKAEEAIFSPYRISKAERGIASKVVPFYSFARQATPFVAKTALNRPGTLSKYEKAKTAVEGLTPERKGEFVPDYAKGQIRTPFKDKEGRSYYFNPQFIYPWGNLDEAGGDIKKGKLPFGLSVNPLATIPAEGIMNKQLYTGQPITKSSSKRQQTKDYLKWAAKSIGPTVLSSAEKIIGAATGQEVGGRKRNIPATLLDVAGIKTASFVPEEQKKYQRTNVIYQLKDINSEIKKLKKQKNPDQKVIDELLQKRKELLQNK